MPRLRHDAIRLAADIHYAPCHFILKTHYAIIIALRAMRLFIAIYLRSFSLRRLFRSFGEALFRHLLEI